MRNRGRQVAMQAVGVAGGPSTVCVDGAVGGCVSAEENLESGPHSTGWSWTATVAEVVTLAAESKTGQGSCGSGLEASTVLMCTR